MVGTRKATRNGCDLAFKTAADLGRIGFTIVSGLAFGIDAAAHQGALSVKARTIAVMAGGLDKIYPAANEGLAVKIILGGGMLVSEHPPGTPPYRHHFLARNRIISGLSLATVVVEAPEISGAINTARLAAEQGREAFVFPGTAGLQNYAGSNALIRDGARLVASTEDILADLNVKTGQLPTVLAVPPELNEEEEIIHSFLKQSGQPLFIDKIIEETKLPPQVASRIISSLTIKKAIKEEKGKYSAV